MRRWCLWEFLLTFLSSMKCTESEDEEPIKGKESQLQLSCFINQEVKYLATGLRLVCDTDGNQRALQIGIWPSPW